MCTLADTIQCVHKDYKNKHAVDTTIQLLFMVTMQNFWQTAPETPKACLPFLFPLFLSAAAVIDLLLGLLPIQNLRESIMETDDFCME